MHNVGLGEYGDENFEDNLIPLTPSKVFRLTIMAGAPATVDVLGIV
jgi:hypothetical protein